MSPSAGASLRTVPLVSKVCNVPMAKIATRIMLGKRLREMGLVRRPIPHFGVKEAVFPFDMFPEDDPLLGPETRSTGEVLGMAENYGDAFFKAQVAASQLLPPGRTVLIAVSERDRPGALEAARRFARLGFSIVATEGKTGAFDDSSIRKAAIRHMAPYITTTAAAIATAKRISAHRQGHAAVRSLRQYPAGIAG
jgi:carbamoyl-phosphate synthase large subunit